jgi:hypothetical protein
MSIHLLNVLQCGLLIFAATATADLSSQQIDAIVRRHKDYAASKLTDPDHFISSSALDALATLSFDEHEGQLRECLTLPLSDPSLDVALAQLISRTRPSDLCRVQEIVVAAGKQGVLERTAEPFAANAAITESLALEVMLASRDCKAVQFATAYLVAMVQNNRGPGITQMDRALELIGQYELKSAAARIQLNSIDDALRVNSPMKYSIVVRTA